MILTAPHDPYAGPGNRERLNGARVGCWSPSIDEVNRLV
ncbi:MAG: type II toxin-antitoxin system YoeB family toxin [Caenispirillum sp.]|nr:type II toxin-antitoxin system YoeB family toxin [Caenispirillum sp.]